MRKSRKALLTMETTWCALCDSPFSSIRNCIRHLRRKHGDLGHETASSLLKQKKDAIMAAKKFKCPTCDFRGSSKESIWKHKYRRHRKPLADGKLAKSTKKRLFMACPECYVRIITFAKLIEHARWEHGFQGEITTMQFSTWEDFVIWKEERERNTLDMWVCYLTHMKDGIRRKHYKCIRSLWSDRVVASANEAGQEGADPPTCTSFLKSACKSDGATEIEFCHVHFGHQPNANLPPPNLPPLPNRDNYCESEQHSCEDNHSSEGSDVAVVDSPSCAISKVEDGADLNSSTGYDINNDLLTPGCSEPATCKDACMNIRLRTERLFDYLSAYIAQLAVKGDKEAERELEKVESGIKTVMQEITHGNNLSTAALLLRRELASENRHPVSTEHIGRRNNPISAEKLIEEKMFE